MATKNVPEVPEFSPVPGVQKWGLEMASEEETKHDMLKWMLGCSRGVKMVAKINSHDASEEKGPAAQGVVVGDGAVRHLLEGRERERVPREGERGGVHARHVHEPRRARRAGKARHGAYVDCVRHFIFSSEAQ